MTRIDEIAVGDQLPGVEFALPVYRLVISAGATRDFNSIHHNSRYAQSTGARDMYANTLFLQGMWERTVRDWAGSHAIIQAMRGLRMARFNLAGTAPRVVASVKAIDREHRVVTVAVHTEDDEGITVGPGEIDLQFI